MKPEFSFYLLGERTAVMQSKSTQIDVNCQRVIWGIAHQLKQMGTCIDIVPGMNNLSALVDPQQQSASALLETLQELAQSTKPLEFQARQIQIPVCYGGDDGPDLELVAQHCQLSPAEVITLHSQAEYLVHFLGFQPGFAYLGGLAPQLHTPRRAEPRLKITAGSVGIGGSQTGIYPAASPGGWQIIGRTKLRLFDPQQGQPSLLQAGDIVRFVVELSDV
jgi:KipI family sensor histidine kinase inhibitor